MSRSQQHKVYVQGFASDGQAMAEGVHNPFNPFDDEEGGEEGWWDETSLVDIDFVNDRAWTAADGEVAIDTLLGTEDTEEAWGTTSYSSANIDENGYYSADSAAFLGSLKTTLLAGVTAKIKLLDQATFSSGYLFAFVSSDGANAVETSYHEANGVGGLSWGGTYAAEGGTPVLDGLNIVASTLTPTRAEFALNGSLASVETLTSADWPTSGDSPLSLAVFGWPANARVQSITLYTALSDTTGLAELSALPVVPWWDPTSVVDIDFVNNRAWTAADGEVAITTLLGSDNSDDAWGPSSYDPSHLSASGYQSPFSGRAAFVGAAKTSILAGSTVRIQILSGTSDGGGYSCEAPLLISSDGLNGIQTVFHSNLGVWSVTYNSNVDNSGGTAIHEAVNVVAATLTPTRIETALNGVAVTTATIGEGEWTTEGEGTIDLALLETGQKTHVQTFTIYAPLPDTTGLAELSALS